MSATLRVPLAIASAFIAFAVSGGTAAHAASCGSQSLAYGRFVYAPVAGTVDGGIAFIRDTRIYEPYGGNHVTDEMWITTSAANPCRSWVEAGLLSGAFTDAQMGPLFGRMKFWFEWNRSDNFAGHWEGWYSLGSGPIAFKISYSGSNSWGVYMDGSQVGGTSHDHDPWAYELKYGVETTTTGAVETGFATALQKRSSSSGTWSYGWPTLDIRQDPGATARWTSYPTEAATTYN